MAEVGGEQRKPIGTFCGFQLSLEKINNGFTVGTGIALRNKLTYTAEIDITGDIGNVTRLENLFSKGFDRRLSELEEKLTRTQTDLQEALAAKGKPFEHAEELAEKSARLEQLNRELEVGQNLSQVFRRILCFYCKTSRLEHAISYGNLHLRIIA